MTTSQLRPLEFRLQLGSILPVVLFLSVSCSATGSQEPDEVQPPEADEPSSAETGAGGTPPITTATGGVEQEVPSSGGTLHPADTPPPPEEEAPHPLLGAGAYPSIDNSDPCRAAQHWELEVVLDMSPGALILKDGVVWEVTGNGVEHGWTMEMNAPPCLTPNTVCDDLVYEEVIACPE